jgi:hypothetical protein
VRILHNLETNGTLKFLEELLSLWCDFLIDCLFFFFFLLLQLLLFFDICSMILRLVTFFLFFLFLTLSQVFVFLLCDLSQLFNFQLLQKLILRILSLALVRSLPISSYHIPLVHIFLDQLFEEFVFMRKVVYGFFLYVVHDKWVNIHISDHKQYQVDVLVIIVTCLDQECLTQ